MMCTRNPAQKVWRVTELCLRERKGHSSPDRLILISGPLPDPLQVRAGPGPDHYGKGAPLEIYRQYAVICLVDHNGKEAMR